MDPTGHSGSGVAVVVVAAGSGTRMSSPLNKIFLPVAGTPILVRTLTLFESMETIDSMVVVTSAVDRAACEALVGDGHFRRLRGIVTGGPSRHASEARGLSSLEADVEAGLIDIILVHDAVRPFVAAEQVEAVVAEARSSGAAILAVPVAGPLVTVGEDGTAQDGGDDLWVAQTPQAFRATLVLDAHRRAADDGFVGTDTSSVVERTGHPVSVVIGRPENIKITTSDDLLRAEFIAEQLIGGSGLARLGTLTPRV